ncbi:PepSY-associated TM helix domain-containing protein [Rugamonas sp. CCM 8940]|uniref:PepSY-associated TM helix domain-containing protein n=1 Tax=Rugamonas sp. CCM 8940 TaxID=2765359 RepID=UPI001F24D5D3|nr:PepSY domain-containing protein [Rugamonas sp. CCM 8940]
MRSALARLHRWLGLSLGLLLALIGLSGSMMLFERPFDAALNPALFHNLVPCAAQLDVGGAVGAVRERWPDATVEMVTMPLRAGAPYRIAFQAPGVAENEAMADSCSGFLLGSRARGRIALDPVHLMPLLQRWHHSLLQGQVGRAALGYLGLVWLAALLAGLALAKPAPGRGEGRGRGAWRRALGIRLDRGGLRASRDLHRVLGLLALPLLSLAAFTGFSSGLPELSRSLVGQFTEVGGEHRRIARPALAVDEESISWNEARSIAEQHLSDGATLVALSRLPERGLFQARLRRVDDWQRTGTLRLFIDLRRGEIVDTVNPIGGRGGDRFLAALFPLHSGQFGGAPGRCLMAFAGILPSLFLISGVAGWILRRQTRRA